MKKAFRNHSVALSVALSSISIASAESVYSAKYQNDVLSNRISHSFQTDTSSLNLEQLTHRFFGENGESGLTKLNYSKGFNGKKIYFNLSKSDNENSNVIGLGWNNVTVSFLNGSSDSFIRDAGTYANAYRFGLHGGNSVGFKFHGAAIDTKINKNFNAQIGFAKLQSNHQQLEDRSTEYFQLSSNNVFGRFSLLDRGEKRIGYSMEAGYNLGSKDFLIQHINTTTDKELTRFRTRFSLNHATDVMLDLSNTKDPLHFDDSRYTGLLSFTHRLNTTPTFRYSLKEDGAQAKAKKAPLGNKTVLIGLGVIAGAALGSSGSEEVDTASRQQSERAAAFAVLNGINPVSVSLNREHGGWIYRNQDNTYGSSSPVIGTVSSVFLPNPASVLPGNSTLTASYHTHAGPDPRFDNENFSPTDINSDNFLGIGGYLATPGGAFKYHFGGRVTNLGAIAN